VNERRTARLVALPLPPRRDYRRWRTLKLVRIAHNAKYLKDYAADTSGQCFHVVWLLVQNHAQERAVDFEMAIVVNKA
jgi:hypothetical protein